MVYLSGNKSILNPQRANKYDMKAFEIFQIKAFVEAVSSTYSKAT